MSDPRVRIAAVLLATVAVLFAWWGWKQGAYFGSVFYPGAFAVFGLVAFLFAFVPFNGQVRGPARVALVGIVGLAAWTLLSGLWSDIPATALKDGAHVFLYAALFGVGVWATHLLGMRMLTALTPLAIAGGLVGIATVAVLATGTDVTWYLHDDATLRFPIGYRNANSTFFLVCLWPVLALASEARWRWEARAALIALGTILVELALLAQSRGSMPAVVVALLAFLLLVPHRLRAAVVLSLMVLPVLPAVPALLDVFQHGEANAAVVPLLRTAAKAIGATAILSFLLAALVLRGVYPRLRLEPATVGWISRVAAVTAVLVTLTGGAIFVARHGGPVDFVDQRVAEFREVGYPDLSGQGVRYGTNVGSNRHDFWRVAVDEGLARPLTGGGAGSFQFAYLKHRESDESPEDPHSVGVLIFSELGIVGLLLFVAFLGGAAMVGWRSRSLGPAAAGLAAGALAGAAQWLIQSSFDWYWSYPGVTAPAAYLLGVATAPALLGLSAPPSRRLRVLGVVASCALALMIVPLFLSDRYAQRAHDERDADPAAALADLDRAARLDPLDAEPLLTKGAIESSLGERALALESFREAADREPKNYAPHYFIARELALADPVVARAQLRIATGLNPRDPRVAALRRRLEPTPPSG